MKDKIHKLRSKIDGLAQLTKSLIKPIVVVDVNSLPVDETIQEMIEEWNRSNIIRRDSAFVANSIQFFDSSCIGEAHRSLLLSKAWLGKALGHLEKKHLTKTMANANQWKILSQLRKQKIHLGKKTTLKRSTG